tara:strand:+ start:344 stop:487 length:144 start_codon:yes stop_codon:yes gene_type:complete
MNVVKSIAYMMLFSAGFIAVKSVTNSTMVKVQNFIGGAETSNGNGGV